MRRIAILFFIFLGVMSLIACEGAAVGDAEENKVTIRLELDENYDDSDPFINERLFCVAQDLDSLTAEVTLAMNGRTGILEIRNNITDEILWSDNWEGDVKSEGFSISLADLKQAEEYVICFRGTEITHAVIEVAFERDFVKEKEAPTR